MTERQMRAQAEQDKYNAALKTKVVKYLGCTISYKNTVGYGYFVVETPWDSHWIESESFKTISKAKEVIKRVHNKMMVETEIENAFHEANLIGSHVDIYEVIASYKTLYSLSETEKDKIYNDIAKRMGFTS